MITIISPAKSLDFESKIDIKEKRDIEFPDKTNEILAVCENLSKADISKIMGVSDKITDLNYDRFQRFDTLPEKQALFAYNGDVYNNIDVINYNKEELEFAERNLRIISGLYGLLTPLTLIKPYRLEMATKLKGFASNGLANFWKEEVSKKINSDLSKHKTKYIINLASNEYSTVLDKSLIDGEIINIHFREKRDGKLKNIALNSKKARGMLANYIITNKIDTKDGLYEFTKANYEYNRELSDQKNLYFEKNKD